MAIFHPHDAFFRSNSLALFHKKAFVWTKNIVFFPLHRPGATSLLMNLINT